MTKKAKFRKFTIEVAANGFITQVGRNIYSCDDEQKNCRACATEVVVEFLAEISNSAQIDAEAKAKEESE